MNIWSMGQVFVTLELWVNLGCAVSVYHCRWRGCYFCDFFQKNDKCGGKEALFFNDGVCARWHFWLNKQDFGNSPPQISKNDLVYISQVPNKTSCQNLGRFFLCCHWLLMQRHNYLLMWYYPDIDASFM